ncbi:MAG: ketose-bisphosphate aldolase [Propioniciclava sp.]
MPIASSHEVLGTAAAEGRAVAAFNVITLEHAEAIVAGATREQAPVILQLSQNAIRFHERPTAIAAAMHAVAETAPGPVVLHLDHLTDPDLLRQTAELGFSSVMFDGSTLDYADNVAATAAAVDWGRQHGIWIEAELGEVGGKDGAHAPGVRTDPAEAAAYVAATGVDALAVAVGSSHAMTTQSAALDLDLIRRLADAVPVPLVLHGSSGVPDAELAAARDRGMRKINIGTALNISYTGAIRAALAESDGVDPRRYLAQARAAVTDTVAHAISVLTPAT